mmetsp:Transcript_40373/g.126330  ORF Transcript_40373/g.126330 Transcript_40373/m.126330 type:complete len:428 (-) Transcript_40373:69-1352(-)
MLVLSPSFPCGIFSPSLSFYFYQRYYCLLRRRRRLRLCGLRASLAHLLELELGRDLDGCGIPEQRREARHGLEAAHLVERLAAVACGLRGELAHELVRAALAALAHDVLVFGDGGGADVRLVVRVEPHRGHGRGVAALALRVHVGEGEVHGAAAAVGLEESPLALLLAHLLAALLGDRRALAHHELLPLLLVRHLGGAHLLRLLAHAPFAALPLLALLADVLQLLLGVLVPLLRVLADDLRVALAPPVQLRAHLRHVDALAEPEDAVLGLLEVVVVGRLVAVEVLHVLVVHGHDLAAVLLILLGEDVQVILRDEVALREQLAAGVVSRRVARARPLAQEVPVPAVLAEAVPAHVAREEPADAALLQVRRRILRAPALGARRHVRRHLVPVRRLPSLRVVPHGGVLGWLGGWGPCPGDPRGYVSSPAV